MNTHFKDLYSGLAHVASQEPENTAFITGDKRTTYHELLYSTDRAADMFWQLGVRKGDRVAIAMRNSVEFVVSYYALAKLGAVAVPINFMVSKEEELFFILDNSHTKGVVTEKEFAKNYLRVRPRLPELKFILSTDFTGLDGVDDFWQSLKKAHYHPQTQKPWADEHDIISILYTSGTTGNPKGVLLSHHNQLENARAAAEGLQPGKKDVFMCLLPMFHTFAWTGNVVVPLLIGAKTLIVKNLTPPKPWLQAMGREGVTIMIAVPQIYGVLAKEAKGLKKFFLKYWALRRVRLCLSGAAPLTHSVKNLFEEAFGIPILEGYGLTETSPVVSINLPKARKHGSVGRPIPGVRVKIIDERGAELACGEEGEICVHGPNVTRGYHANEDATKALFTDDGWLRTGDIGVVDQEGYIFIRDRKKDMIIVKGLKVFPAQVEQVICHHPKVQEAAVIGIPDEFGNETIKCFCVVKTGEKLDRSELSQYMKANLDGYKRPRDIEFVESLPKNSLQKVLKRELIRMELEKRLKTKLS
ncbi:MAG: long-chain-fatty-acid--CoA ligase [Elusimicrobiales bacterium]|nr:long-chain-fatty-acid--CoA ligase [Elusimicrobiales bacterium]